MEQRKFLLIPQYNAAEFANLVCPLFWLKDIRLRDGTVFTPMVFKARRKEDIPFIIRDRIKQLPDDSLTCLSRYERMILKACLDQIEQKTAISTPFEAIQALKKQGFFLLPEDCFAFNCLILSEDEEIELENRKKQICKLV